MEKKQPKCNPCEWEKILAEAKDGEMLAAPSKCVGCDYSTCNYNL